MIRLKSATNKSIRHPVPGKMSQRHLLVKKKDSCFLSVLNVVQTVRSALLRTYKTGSCYGGVSVSSSGGWHRKTHSDKYCKAVNIRHDFFSVVRVKELLISNKKRISRAKYIRIGSDRATSLHRRCLIVCSAAATITEQGLA